MDSLGVPSGSGSQFVYPSFKLDGMEEPGTYAIYQSSSKKPVFL